MPARLIRHRRVAAALGLAALAAGVPAAGALAQQAAPATHLRGTVTALEGDTLAVTARDGAAVRVRLPAGFGVTAVLPAELSQVQKGTFVGTAAEPQPDGRLKALEVVVFPEALRGTGEGHYGWDLTPQSTMTNATVDTVVSDVQGRTLTLAYPGGEKSVVVPEGVPIVTLGPGDASMLKPGSHVFLNAQRQPDGTYTAARVAVGKDGLVPPM